MRNDLKAEYRTILQAYLDGAGEAAVMRAYDFARQCARAGLAPDDVMAMHVDIIEQHLTPEQRAAAQDLLLEIIMAFSLSYRQALQDLERANEELERLSRFKSRMLSMVAHDLGNHIAAVKILVHPMKKDGDERIAGILQAVEDQEHLIQNLLDIGRIESGRMQLDLEPVALVPLLERCVDRVRRVSGNHTFSLSAPAIAVLADAQKLQQVFDNLVGNAVKYSPEGGPVDITVAAVGDEAEVAVRDRGIGVAEKDLPYLFEPFYRGANHGRGISGSGLGLAIVKSLVGLLRGSITVESQAGQGTTFRVRLPLSRVTARRPPELPVFPAGS